MTTTLTVYDTPATAVPTTGFWSRARRAGAVYIGLGARTAVINVAIEGQLLTGAFMGALFGTVFASTLLGLVAAALGGALIAGLLAVLAIRYLVDQVVLGVVLNVFALGFTGFLFTQ